MTYRGNFTIIQPDGTEAEMTGTLNKHTDPRSGLRSWDGTATADPSTAPSFEPGMVRLRLPGGGEADALLQDVRYGADRWRGQSLAMILVGSGPPPF